MGPTRHLYSFPYFVVDLSSEVNEEVLLQAFSAFGSVFEARVIWDMKTGRSCSYVRPILYLSESSKL